MAAWPRPRRRGWPCRNARPDDRTRGGRTVPHRPDRAHRLWQVDGRADARSAGCRRSSMPMTLARACDRPGERTLGPIRARFGDAVFAADGALDRAALARIVFADPAALADLEAIVHPRVRELVEAALDDATRVRRAVRRGRGHQARRRRPRRPLRRGLAGRLPRVVSSGSGWPAGAWPPTTSIDASPRSRACGSDWRPRVTRTLDTSGTLGRDPRAGRGGPGGGPGRAVDILPFGSVER